jgi:hypothetical protein
LYESLRKKINQILKEIQYLSSTIGAWSDRRAVACIIITGNFIDDGFKPQAMLLDFVRMKGKHTGENIRNLRTDIIEKLGVSEKVYRIITDNASNMMTAYRFGLIVAETDNDDDESGEHDGPDSIRSEECNFDTEWMLTDPVINQNDETIKIDAKNCRTFLLRT